jgi:hypothetical protein
MLLGDFPPLPIHFVGRQAPRRSNDTGGVTNSTPLRFTGTSYAALAAGSGTHPSGAGIALAPLFGILAP